VESPRLAVARSLYGFNWAAVSGRERGLARIAEVVDPEFEAHFSPEVGGRVVHGIEELRQFGYALEEDFAELTYDPDEFFEIRSDQIVVLGTIHGRGRVSGMPVRGEFGHVWTFADGRPRTVRAFLSHEQALKTVGTNGVDARRLRGHRPEAHDRVSE
jgi:ketosteroid isomerase-like protein